MIYDASAEDAPLRKHYHYCIIGSGPAGTTLALKLARAGRRVALIEAGDRDLTAESQEVYEGTNLGLDNHDPAISRLRFLGGTSGHWGGRCLLLDPADFEPRPDVPLSGWPISYDDLAPYQQEAAEWIGCPPFGPTREAADSTGDIDIVAQSFSSQRGPFEFWDLQHSESRRFGSHYFNDLKTTRNLDLVLNANFQSFSIDTDNGRIRRAGYLGYDMVRREVEADTFIMAMGGLENARFLLDLNENYGDAFGNQGKMVGRCFMDHLLMPQGLYFITRRLYAHSPYWQFERLVRRTVPQLVLSPSSEFARKNGILNGGFWLDRIRRSPLPDAEVGGNTVLQNLKYDEDYFFTGSTHVVGQQAPNPNSRIQLTDQRDKFGMRRIGLDWQVLPRDIEAMRRVTLEAARFLIRSGLGRMQIAPDLWNSVPATDIRALDASSHHMGGARMSKTPETGVVDADCRVHGARNLYVAGSGVFPTSGFANPTFTITQLALRLADHLLSNRS